MDRNETILDGLVALVAGAAASATMTPVTTLVQHAQSQESLRQETRASYGVADDVALEKVAKLVRLPLTETRRAVGRGLMHSTLGIGLAPVYMTLRRRTRLAPWAAGVVAGLGLFVVFDEGLNPLLGFTPPPQAYPLATHARGLVGHLVLGLTLAAVTEAGWAATGRRP